MSDLGRWQFSKPDWRTVPDGDSGGNKIVGEVGVHELEEHKEYWKCFQRYRDGSGGTRVKVRVFSIDVEERKEAETPSDITVHHDQTSGLDVPPEIWNQLIQEARREGILAGSR